MANLTKAFYPVRFGEALRLATDRLDCKNFYAFNPDFDKKQAKATAMRRSRNGR